MSSCTNASGFSLVELMIALALSLFLIGGLTATFLASRVTATETETLSRVQENVRFASDYLIRDLRNAGFRDQLTLTFNQYGMIGREFAAYGGANNDDQTQVIVRYAGRGACGQMFSSLGELKIIENRYFIDDGNLTCNGIERISDDPDVLPISNETVTLASGISEMRFQFLDVGGNTSDNICNLFDDDPVAFDDACVGVRVQLFFEGQPERVVELNASFRNVILDRLYGRE